MGLPRNQLPLERHHFNAIAQVHGQETADQVLAMHRFQLENGGVNPVTVELVFQDGEMDEHMLIEHVLANFTAWKRFGN